MDRERTALKGEERTEKMATATANRISAAKPRLAAKGGEPRARPASPPLGDPPPASPNPFWGIFSHPSRNREGGKPFPPISSPEGAKPHHPPRCPVFNADEALNGPAA